MSIIEFLEQEQREMFSIVASVLHLGNVGFVEVEGHSKVNKLESLDPISKVLSQYIGTSIYTVTNKT